MVIFPLAPDQTIAQMWSSGARGNKMGLLYNAAQAHSSRTRLCPYRGTELSNKPSSTTMHLLVYPFSSEHLRHVKHRRHT